MGTKLEIINHCLDVVNERAVTTVNSSHPTASKAVGIIDHKNKQIQSMGWWFNKEFNLVLSPNTLGEIVLPTGLLEVTPHAPYNRLVRRKSKLYDPVNHTYNIGAAVTTTIIVLLDIEDLPEKAFNFLSASAAYDMFASDDGDVQTIEANNLVDDFNRTWQQLQKEELKQSGVNSSSRIVVQQLHRYRRTSSGNPDVIGG